MAKTRRKIARIPFDDLETGQAVRAMWSSGDAIDNTQGLFVGFVNIEGEWFLVIRVLEWAVVSTKKKDWVDRGPVEISTRANIEVWTWDRKGG